MLDLTAPEWAFPQPREGIDQLLVRGADAGPVETWPAERRRLEGRVLSDHAPIEVTVS
jgi:hypothetical protein